MRDAQEHRVQFNLDTGGLGRHGSPGPRGQVARPGARDSRFGRMFPFLPEADTSDRAIGWLAARMQTDAMAGQSVQILDLPAGYTYLGQFIDHDVTFDPTSKLQRDNDPNALFDFRTPRLDLDSLYGSGPLDQPFLYDWDGDRHRGVKLLVGSNPAGSGFAAEDLPRNEQGRALIGDARNDENLIVSQLHLLFIHFHNKVVDRIAGDPANRNIASTKLFEEAQRTVRWHYQWIVVHDFLPRIVESTAAEPGSADAQPLTRPWFFRWHHRPFMPVEFSAAAYRFGHSMVREDYRPNDRPGQVPILNRRGRDKRFLGGFRWLPADLKIQWKRFFETTTGFEPQKAMRIDPYLSKALSNLPSDHAALASLNLLRGKALGLPAGPDVARAIGETPLSRDDLLHPLHLNKDGTRIDRQVREALLHATPLWYYILCEARALGEGGQRLGPVGGRIVAEVLLGLLDDDPQSYLRQWPKWTPDLPARVPDSFTMADLVRFTEAPPPG
jgi:Animal haem peroxidase